MSSMHVPPRRTRVRWLARGLAATATAILGATVLATPAFAATTWKSVSAGAYSGQLGIGNNFNQQSPAYVP